MYELHDSWRLYTAHFFYECNPFMGWNYIKHNIQNVNPILDVPKMSLQIFWGKNKNDKNHFHTVKHCMNYRT